MLSKQATAVASNALMLRVAVSGWSQQRIAAARARLSVWWWTAPGWRLPSVSRFARMTAAQCWSSIGVALRGEETARSPLSTEDKDESCAVRTEVLAPLAADSACVLSRTHLQSATGESCTVVPSSTALASMTTCGGTTGTMGNGVGLQDAFSVNASDKIELLLIEEQELDRDFLTAETIAKFTRQCQPQGRSPLL